MVQRLAVRLARVLAYTDIYEMSASQHVHFPTVIEELVRRYQFQKFPQSFEESDLTKGVEFYGGIAGRAVISKLVIWESLLVLENESSTESAKEVLEGVISWLVSKFSLRYAFSDIKRFAYVSDVSFYSDARLLALNPAVEKLYKHTSALLTDIWQENVEYLTTSLKIGHDPVLRKFGIAPFSIERKGDARFSENKYFSEAPLPTTAHIDMLKQFEAEILEQQREYASVSRTL